MRFLEKAQERNIKLEKSLWITKKEKSFEE